MTDYSTIIKLNLSNKGLTKLPDLSIYPNLQILYCSYNELTSLDNLPIRLQELYCSSNKLTSLNNLPIGLQKLYCLNNPFNYNFEITLENIRKYNLENHK
jgi:Leucine-rich repeat (LRR) protein